MTYNVFGGTLSLYTTLLVSAANNQALGYQAVILAVRSFVVLPHVP